jgi:hypothetical protein
MENHLTNKLKKMKKDVRFFELLQKWLHGDFGNKDEKELNSMLKNDDFQREAMEGYHALPEHDHDVNLMALKEKLRGKTMPVHSPVFSMQRMLSAAAVFALLVAAFWFIPRILDRKQDEVAQNLPVLEKKEIPEVTSMEEKEAPELDQMRQRSSNINKKIDNSVPVKPTDAINEIPSDYSQITNNENAAVASSSDAESLRSAPTSSTETSDNVADKNTESKPAISEPAPAVLPSKTPPNLNANVENNLAKRKKTTEPKAKKSNKAKEEVTYNDTDSKPNMEALKDKNEEIPAASEPAGGWDAFNEYCRTSARLTDAARNNNVSGVVRLQFNISNNGDPINFLTIKSLGYGCDEEAIRLVKDFEWIRGKSGLVNVEIKFAR